MKRYLYLFNIIILSILPLVQLLSPGLPVTHDGTDHVARIANFYASIQEGNLIPRWAGNLNWGYGHPILMFLYPLSSYIASLLLFMGIPLITSVKLVFAISYSASLVAMYFWMREHGGERAGFVAALLYGFAPYRFVDLSVRGALGEHVAFVFPPLLFLGFLKLAHGRDSRMLWMIFTSFMLAGLILSHNAVSLMILPIAVLYIIYLFFFVTKARMQFFVTAVLSTIIGFGLAAFFWIPAFFEGKYTLRDIVTKDDVFDRFVPITQFFVSPWSYGGTSQLSKEVGLVHWLGIVASIIFLFRTKEKKKRLLFLLFIVIFVLSLIIEIPWIKPLWLSVSILQKFQFPWRFLTVAVFAASVLGGLVSVEEKLFRKFWVLAGFATILLLQTHAMWQPKGFDTRTDRSYMGIYDGTTDTGESSPIWSVRFMEHRAATPMEVIDGDVKIKQISRTSTEHVYEIAAIEKSRIVENTLYFPGWKIFVDGVSTEIEFQDPRYRGLMTFFTGIGTHSVIARFGDTKVRMNADRITLLSLGIVLILAVTGLIWYKQRKYT